MPDPTFDAECSRCGKVTTWREAERERHRVRGADRAAKRSDFFLEHEQGFECQTCYLFATKVRAVDGGVHKRAGTGHVVTHGDA